MAAWAVWVVGNGKWEMGEEKNSADRITKLRARADSTLLNLLLGSRCLLLYIRLKSVFETDTVEIINNNKARGTKDVSDLTKRRRAVNLLEKYILDCFVFCFGFCFLSLYIFYYLYYKDGRGKTGR